MQRVEEAAIAEWSESWHIRLPRVVDINCPYCHRKVTFAIKWLAPAGGIRVVWGQARCPGCSKTPLFMLIDVHQRRDNSPQEGVPYIYPAPRLRSPLSGLDDIQQISRALRRAYRSAVNVFNAAEWEATAVSCRRVLEGITKSILPPEDHKLPLAQQIEALPKHTDLDKPVLTLAHSLRDGGNLGAHFDLQRTPNQEVAELMVDLLDDLLEFLFILPGRIEELNSRIAAVDPESAG